VHKTKAETRRRLRLAVAAAVAALGLTAVAVAVNGPAAAADNPYQRGPDPTAASIAATYGPFATAQMTVPPGNGFNGGYVYYPTDTSLGTWGAVANFQFKYGASRRTATSNFGLSRSHSAVKLSSKR